MTVVGAGDQAGIPVGLLLALDASPGVGSVALVNLSGVNAGRGGTVVAARAIPMRAPPAAPHAELARNEDPLMRAVAELLDDAGVRVDALAGVACGAGPGGFTSLRITAAIAKGLAHATGRPLLAAPSLAWAAAVRAPAAAQWIVTLDALRGERYVANVTLAAPPAAAPAAAQGAVWSVVAYEYLGVHAIGAVAPLAAARGAGVLDVDADVASGPIAAGAAAFAPAPVDVARWEPAYGRVAEAQARWEAAHGPMPAATIAPDAGVAL